MSLSSRLSSTSTVEYTCRALGQAERERDVSSFDIHAAVSTSPGNVRYNHPPVLMLILIVIVILTVILIVVIVIPILILKLIAAVIMIRKARLLQLFLFP